MNYLFQSKPKQSNNASTAATIEAINSTLKSRGGVYSGYSCKTVSWDDVSRGTVGGGLSCWGSNITDTYLKAKDGRSLYTVRSDNWNETLGSTHSEGIAFVGSKTGGGGGTTELRPYTLKVRGETSNKRRGSRRGYALFVSRSESNVRCISASPHPNTSPRHCASLRS